MNKSIFLRIKQFCLGLLIGLSCNSAHSMDLLDDLDIFDPNIAIDDITFDTKKVNPADILPLLVEILDILPILQEDLYCKTYPLNKRSLLDLPFVRPYRWHSIYDQKVGVQLFYNQTDRMHFTGRCDNISSYLAICNSNLLRKLSDKLDEDIIREQFPDFDLDPLCIFPLFRNMTIQERRLGFMFSGSQRWKTLTFRAYAPLYYLERNYFLTNQERKAVEDVFGEQSDTEFQDQHMISDKIGIGDTRLVCAYHVLRCPDIALNLGFQLTIPTAFPFKKGLKGASFQQWKKIRHCKFSIQELWELAQEDVNAATEYGSDFFLGALDTLSANLLDTPLGNNQHLGIGLFFQNKSRLSYYFKRPWADQIHYKGNISLEYLLPRTERRFFLIRTDNDSLDKRLFDEERADDDPAYAANWLNLIEETFTNKFYPVALDTRIQPGLIFHWTSNMFYERGPWRYQLGTDWYIQTPTSLESLEVPQDIGACNIELKKAEPPYMYQSKICGGIYYSFERPCRTWNLSLYGDYTYWTEGLGKDFTLSLNLEVDF